ncbi:EamA family transporter RarD [Actinomadura alba]|uniref:EamA family transporter RarD n=1 Tax=Actinomadura alba TaxID=406431 RepID=A0ABR7LWB7_9ACTN|nr:EamA family transporter RarD [Actinomadura alba]MBC6469145.1 EamA family transporter RarD [Actinomadura alba]
MPDERRGVALGVLAYVLWGMSALYWPLLEPVSAVEILALRIVLSFVALVGLLTLLRRWNRVRRLARGFRQVCLLVIAGALTSVNWGLFIFATMTGHVVDAALGYFITPLVSIFFGVVIFRERLRAWQWAAFVLGVVSVVVLTVDYGTVPWIAGGLALTFGIYGLIKKHVSVGALEGLMVETAAFLPFALVFTVALQVTGNATFGHVSVANTCLVIGAGFVMLIPMLLFSAAATRIPLSVTGMLQFIEPCVQFLIGLLVFHESMSVTRWGGFVLVWGALITLSIDGLRVRRRMSGAVSSTHRSDHEVPTL